MKNLIVGRAGEQGEEEHAQAARDQHHNDALAELELSCPAAYPAGQEPEHQNDLGDQNDRQPAPLELWLVRSVTPPNVYRQINDHLQNHGDRHSGGHEDSAEDQDTKEDEDTCIFLRGIGSGVIEPLAHVYNLQCASVHE